MTDRVVLAYSGGLDTSVGIGWIAEETGAEVIAVQAAEQFVLYTGVRPTPDQVQWASEFSRA